MTTTIDPRVLRNIFLHLLLPMIGEVKGICNDSEGFEGALNEILPRMARGQKPHSSIIKKMLSSLGSQTPVSYLVVARDSKEVGFIMAEQMGKRLLVWNDGQYESYTGEHVTIAKGTRVALFATSITNGEKAAPLAKGVSEDAIVDTIYCIINYGFPVAQRVLEECGIKNIFSAVTLSNILEVLEAEDIITYEERIQIEKQAKAMTGTLSHA